MKTVDNDGKIDVFPPLPLLWGNVSVFLRLVARMDKRRESSEEDSDSLEHFMVMLDHRGEEADRDIKKQEEGQTQLAKVGLDTVQPHLAGPEEQSCPDQGEGGDAGAGQEGPQGGGGQAQLCQRY